MQHVGEALVQAMKMALAAGEPAAAQLVACECVVLAETKDHADWELIGACAEAQEGDRKPAGACAYEEIEDEEDEHLYHTKGWCRELWLKSSASARTLPPAEEKQDVKTASRQRRQAKKSEEPRRKKPHQAARAGAVTWLTRKLDLRYRSIASGSRGRCPRIAASTLTRDICVRRARRRRGDIRCPDCRVVVGRRTPRRSRRPTRSRARLDGGVDVA